MNEGTIPGLVAAATLATKQYHVVKPASTAGQIKLAAAGDDLQLGILLNNPGAGGEAAIAGPGTVADAIMGTSVGAAAGASLSANSTGQLAPYTTAGARIARALQTWSAAGDIIRVVVDIH